MWESFVGPSRKADQGSWWCQGSLQGMAIQQLIIALPPLPSSKASTVYIPIAATGRCFNWLHFLLSNIYNNRLALLAPRKKISFILSFFFIFLLPSFNLSFLAYLFLFLSRNCLTWICSCAIYTQRNHKKAATSRHLKKANYHVDIEIDGTKSEAARTVPVIRRNGRRGKEREWYKDLIDER